MKEDSIEEDIKNAENFIKSIKTDKEYKEENGWHGYYNKEIVELARMLEHILSDYKRVLKDANRYKNMYKAEHEIHLVRNEQLDRKENAIIKCKELENENKKLKEMYYKFANNILENFVSVRKIERQIEALDDNLGTYRDEQRMIEKFLYAKKVLKILLEDTRYIEKEV